MHPGSPPRILFVDDDSEIVAAVRAHIIHQGWEFSSHGFIADALTEIRRLSPHLVLLDRRLPDGDGLDICRQMRADARLSGVPVIMATSRSELKDRLAAFAAGAQDYVIKPFDPFELVARIGVHLEGVLRPAGPASPNTASQLAERLNLDVVDMVMHDIRAPLATIKMLVDLIKRDKAPFTHKADLLMIAKTSVDAALLMINDHLDLKLGRIEPHPESVSIDDLLRRLGSIFKIQFDHTHVALVFQSPPSLTVVTDGILLFRIIQNLISNARKFSPPSGTVTVRITSSPESLTAEVSDQGPGIPETDRRGLFDRERTAPSSDGRQGFGIGLKFCRLALDAMGGSIRIEDAPGGGSRFIVSIPLGRPAR